MQGSGQDDAVWSTTEDDFQKLLFLLGAVVRQAPGQHVGYITGDLHRFKDFFPCLFASHFRAMQRSGNDNGRNASNLGPIDQSQARRFLGLRDIVGGGRPARFLCHRVSGFKGMT